jgi:hypothetical protein
MRKNEQVTNYIEQAPAPFKEVMEQLRALIHESVPEVTEEFKWSQPVFRCTKDFCYFKVTKNHVNLGFMEAQKLNDPEGVLEGTGKSMRHVKLKDIAAIRELLFKAWFKASAW